MKHVKMCRRTMSLLALLLLLTASFQVYMPVIAEPVSGSTHPHASRNAYEDITSPLSTFQSGGAFSQKWSSPLCLSQHATETTTETMWIESLCACRSCT